MSLPYDVARCSGTQACHLCADCRRKEQGNQERHVTIMPTFDALTYGTCTNYIKPEVRDD